MSLAAWRSVAAGAVAGSRPLRVARAARSWATAAQVGSPLAPAGDAAAEPAADAEGTLEAALGAAAGDPAGPAACDGAGEAGAHAASRATSAMIRVRATDTGFLP